MELFIELFRTSCCGVQGLSVLYLSIFFFSSRRRHTRCALVTGVQTCALPILTALWFALPNLQAPPSVGVLAEIRVLGRGPVLGALALTVIGSGAMFTDRKSVV